MQYRKGAQGNASKADCQLPAPSRATNPPIVLSKLTSTWALSG
jgi:hypothetical protein